MVFAARLFINMTESVSELIAEYEEAKDRLQSIFTENDNISDAAIRALDSKVSAAFKSLILFNELPVFVHRGGTNAL